MNPEGSLRTASHTNHPLSQSSSPDGREADVQDPRA